MGWSQELNDFSEGFSSGFNMVESGSDRATKKLQRKKLEQETSDEYYQQTLEGRAADIEQSRATTAHTTALTKDLDYKNTDEYRAWEKKIQESEINFRDESTKKLAFENSDEFRDLQRRATEAEIAGTEATAAHTTELTKGLEYQNTDEYRAWERKNKDSETRYRNEQTKELAWKNSDEYRDLAKREAEAGIKSTEATAGKTEADAESQRIKNKMDAFIQSTVTGTQGAQTLQESMEGKKAVDDAAAGATDPPFVQGEEPPGPQSRAVEVPEVTTATHDEVSDTGVEAAIPLEPEAVPTEAAPAEAVSEGVEPVTSEGKPGPRARDRNVPLPEAGPRAHPHVDEQQDRASVRKLPIASATKNVLEYAGTQTGIRAVVFSGGQAHKGEKGPRTGSTRHDGGFAADVRLYDMETGRMLDMRNPEDAERMRDFGMYAVQAGATGIGAGEDYMGGSEMHIGFGPEATWGGAPWIGDALAQGKGIRDQMPDTGQLPDMYESGSVYKEGRKAALAGFEYLANSYGLDQDSAVDSPEMEQAAADLMSGKDAAEPEQVEEAERIAQETAKEAGFELNQDEVPIYTLSMVYNAYIGTGQLEEAQKVAGAITMHYLKLASQYSAVAKVAAGQGDTAGVAEALAKVYANVPDGSKAEFNELSDGRYEVVITNQETGEVTNRNIMTPEEMGGAAMKINPSDFLTVITAAEGKTPAETLSRESAVDMGHPEWAGRSMDEVGTMQAEAKETRLRGGGAVGVEAGDEAGGGGGTVGTGEGFGKLSQGDLEGISTEVKESFTNYAASVAAKGTEGDKYTTQLSPEANSDVMAYIQPIAEQIAIDNFGKLRPALAAEAVIRMIDQEPTSVKPAKGGRFQIEVRGIDPFTISEGLYQRLADARSKFGPQSDGTEPAFRQGSDTRRAMGQLPMLPDYDPTRSRVVPNLRTVRRPSEAGLEPGPEAVPTRPSIPAVQAHPAVGGAVEIPDWLIHESVKNVGGGGGPRQSQRLVPVR